MANEIAKIAAHKPKLPGLSRKEKDANKETVRKIASLHLDKADAELAKLLSDRRTPASTKMKAIEHVFDRIAGKPKLVDEKQTEQTALEKMSAPELMEYITQQFSGLPLSARAIMVESLDKGLAFDAADIMDVIEEAEPLEKPQREKKIPRR